MLNSIVTIVCIALIAFILFWFFKKPEKSGQKAQQKNGYQEIRVEVMGPVLSLTARILHPVWIRLFFQILVYMRTCLWGKSM